jgi:hypothetical protein
MELPDNLKQWSYEELASLNRAIVAHLKERNAVKAEMSMQQFQRGNIVQFQSSDGEQVQGTVIRLNKKTVSLVTAAGAQWNVSPHLLTKVPNGLQKKSDQDFIDFTDSIDI